MRRSRSEKFRSSVPHDGTVTLAWKAQIKGEFRYLSLGRANPVAWVFNYKAAHMEASNDVTPTGLCLHRHVRPPGGNTAGLDVFCTCFGSGSRVTTTCCHGRSSYSRGTSLSVALTPD